MMFSAAARPRRGSAAGTSVARIVSRIAGGWIGAVLAGVPEEDRRLYGPALMAQAGSFVPARSAEIGVVDRIREEVRARALVP